MHRSSNFFTFSPILISVFLITVIGMGVGFIFISLITNDAELLPLFHAVKRNMHKTVLRSS